MNFISYTETAAKCFWDKKNNHTKKLFFSSSYTSNSYTASEHIPYNSSTYFPQISFPKKVLFIPYSFTMQLAWKLDSGNQMCTPSFASTLQNLLQGSSCSSPPNRNCSAPDTRENNYTHHLLFCFTLVKHS